MPVPCSSNATILISVICWFISIQIRPRFCSDERPGRTMAPCARDAPPEIAQLKLTVPKSGKPVALIIPHVGIENEREVSLVNWFEVVLIIWVQDLDWFSSGGNWEPSLQTFQLERYLIIMHCLHVGLFHRAIICIQIADSIDKTVTSDGAIIIFPLH